MALFGMHFEPDGILFKPILPSNIGKMRLLYLPYREMHLDITIEGKGTKIAEFKVNDSLKHKPFLPSDNSGEQRVAIKLIPDFPNKTVQKR